MELLRLGVGTYLDDLHPVEEGSGDGLRRIGRRNEKDIGKVIGEVQVVVREGIVLFGIENLEQGRRGIA